MVLKKNKVLNFRTLLKIETALCFAIPVIFFSFNITGLAVAGPNTTNASAVGIFLFALGILGFATLVFTQPKAKKSKK